MQFSIDNFLKPLKKNQQLLFAFSGGLDSHVLLHWLCHEATIRENFSLRAVYVNHQLSPNAHEWQAFCEEKAKEYDVDFQAVTVEVKKAKGESLEAQARLARYGALKSLMNKRDYLLTGHHQDDQLETFLLQLFRGAGLEGLSAMPVLSLFGEGFQYRPLLSYTQQELTDYAKEHHLTWIEDESNRQLSFDRNYLREEIIPLIKQRWPSVTSTVSRSAMHCATAKKLLDSLQQQSFHELFCEETKTLDMTLLKNYSSEEQIYLIREWLQRLDFLPPSTKKMEEILRTILHSADDKTPCVQWQGVEVRRFDGRLYAMEPLSLHDETMIYPWDLHSDLIIPGLNIKMSVKVKKENVKNLTVKFRQGGETIRLVGHKHSKTLKNLFQEWKIPPWERGRIPLVFEGDNLLAIIRSGTQGVQVMSAKENAHEFKAISL